MKSTGLASSLVVLRSRKYDIRMGRSGVGGNETYCVQAGGRSPPRG